MGLPDIVSKNAVLLADKYLVCIGLLEYGLARYSW